MKRKGFLSLVSVALLFVLAIGSIFIYQRMAINATKEAIEYKNYKNHFVLITDGKNDELWELLYQSALLEGKEKNSYIEFFGKNLSVDYTKQELLRMAIQAKVDGILVEGDESDETVALIDAAVSQGIPVFTVLSDSSRSKRQGFVGLNAYSIGQEYGKQIIDSQSQQSLERPIDVRVVMSHEGDNSAQGRILLGIREILAEEYGTDYVNVETAMIEEAETFAMEEYMRDLFLHKDTQPDYLVCLDAASTTQAFGAAVSYNGVGDVHILGYFFSDAILSAISKNVVDMTLSFDADQMGKYCVEAICDYTDTGYANDYQAVKYTILDKATVDQLLQREEAYDE